MEGKLRLWSGLGVPLQPNSLPFVVYSWARISDFDCRYRYRFNSREVYTCALPCFSVDSFRRSLSGPIPQHAFVDSPRTCVYAHVCLGNDNVSAKALPPGGTRCLVDTPPPSSSPQKNLKGEQGRCILLVRS